MPALQPIKKNVKKIVKETNIPLAFILDPFLPIREIKKIRTKYYDTIILLT